MPASPRWLSRKREQLAARVALGLDVIADVRSIEARGEDCGRVELEPRDDLVSCRRRRGRGERHPRHAREAALELVQREVVLAKVVAPLRDAVRLVDRDQRQPHAGEQLERLLLHETLGRDIEELQRAALQVGDHALLLGVRERRVQERGAHARVAQRADLILHQARSAARRRCRRRRAAAQGSGSRATCRRRSASARASPGPPPRPR